MFARRTVSSISARQTAEMTQPKTPATTIATNALTARSLPIPIPGDRAVKRRNYLKKFYPSGLPGPQHYYTPLPTADPEEEIRGKVAAQTYVSPSEVSDLAPPLLTLEIVKAEPAVLKAEKAKEQRAPVVYGNGHWISLPGVDWVRASGQLANKRNVPSQGKTGKGSSAAQSSVRANLEAHDAAISAKKAAERRAYDEKKYLSPAARKSAENALAEAMEWYERRCKRIARKQAKKQLTEAMEWFDRTVERYERVRQDSAVSVVVVREESALLTPGLEEPAYLGPRPARARELSPELFWVEGWRCACTVDEPVSGVGCGKGGCEV